MYICIWCLYICTLLEVWQQRLFWFEMFSFKWFQKNHLFFIFIKNSFKHLFKFWIIQNLPSKLSVILYYTLNILEVVIYWIIFIEFIQIESKLNLSSQLFWLVYILAVYIWTTSIYSMYLLIPNSNMKCNIYI